MSARPSAASHRPSPSPSRKTAASTPATCNNSRVIDSWPVTRLAAEVVSVPVFDFDVAAVSSEVRDGVGGMLFLGRSPAPGDLGTRISDVVLNAPAHTKPLVMADEEGGGVQRLAPVVSPVPWARDMAGDMTLSAVRALAARVGRQMRAAGVTVDLAPVADVDGRDGPSANNPDGSRSFSGNPQTATAYTVAFMRGLADSGVLPVVKHFPGLGGTTGNTDVRAAATVPISELAESGLLPFRAAIKDGAAAVMVSNASVPGVTTLPASLSANVMTGLLKNQLGFHGLVVTDSLSAGAVLTGGRTLPQAAVRAIAAGADLVLFGSTLSPADTAMLRAANVRRSYDGIIAALTAAVGSGQLRIARLRAAASAVVGAAHDTLCP
jgi:beta-N-acetylhexosaminidase